VLSLLSAIVFALVAVPTLNGFIWTAEQEVMNLWPDELVVRIENGVLSKNIDGPVEIPWPALWQGEINGKAADFEALALIDTDRPSTLAAFREAQTAVMVTREAIVFPSDSPAGIEVLPFEAEIDFTISESVLNTWLAAASPWFKLVAPVLVLLVFVIIMMALYFLLLPLFIVALPVWALLRLWPGAGLSTASYGLAYRLTLHAITLPLIVTALSFWFFGQGAGPLVFALVTLAIIWLNLQSKPTLT
jgi:hypothetical protein